MAALIDAAKGDGRALVVVEQNLAFAELVADRYLVIEQGTVALAGQARRDRSPDAARAPAGVAASSRASQSSGGRSFFRTSGSTGFCR